MNVFERKYETMPREAIEQLQLERLQALLARLKRNVRHYRERLGEREVASLAELAQVPATEPEDLHRAFPYGMLALPLREVVRLHSAVGPDGRQLVIGHTRNDLTHWGRLVARQLVAAGITPNEVIQVCFGGGVTDSALGYLLGAEMLGVSVIPEDASHIEYQLAMMRNYRATVLITTPTNARDLVDLLREQRIDPQSLHLRTLLLTRPAGAAEREALKAGLFADVRCNFGVAEILDPGLCVECPEGRFHVNEDHFLVESRGGELLVTTLCREGMPLLRYACRTACEIRREKCPCGRTGALIEPGARLDGRLRVEETPVYRSQIEAVLAKTRAAGQSFELEIQERRIVISIRVTRDLFTDTVRELEDLRSTVRSEFLSRLGVEAEVRYVTARYCVGAQR